MNRAPPWVFAFVAAVGAVAVVLGFVDVTPAIRFARVVLFFASVVTLLRLGAARVGRLGTPAWLGWLLGALAFILFVGLAHETSKDDASSRWYAFALSVGALLLAGIDAGLPAAPTQLRRGLWTGLGLIALVGYPNWGHAHFGNFIHTWDAYHRYVSAKYALELRDDGLYPCTVVADQEAGRAPNVSDTVSDVVHGGFVSPFVFLADAAKYKARFTPERWKAFGEDVAWFRERVSAKRWNEIQQDAGVHETPAWSLWGCALASVFPPWVLVALDPVWFVLAGLLLYWAFGARGFAAGMLLVGTNWALGFFFWTGGSLLRHEWLFFAVAAVCLLKKDRPREAGVAMGLSGLLIGYPLLMLVGPALLAAHFVVRKQPLPVPLTRFFSSTVAALFLGVLVSAAWAGADGWKAFVDRQHRPVTNHMGLPVLLAHTADNTGEKLRDEAAMDPWGAWKEARMKGVGDARVLQVIFLGLFGWLLFLAVRRHADAPWFALALSAGVIPLVLVETNYHFVFLLPMGAAAAMQRRVLGLVAALTAAGLFVTLSPLEGMSHWLDVQSVELSACAVLAVAAIWASAAWLPDDDASAGPA